jgi:hypothetical protein
MFEDLVHPSARQPRFQPSAERQSVGHQIHERGITRGIPNPAPEPRLVLVAPVERVISGDDSPNRFELKAIKRF